jgi:hypothetical protein
MAQEEIGLSIKLNANEAIKSVGNLKRELKEAERDAIAIAQHFGEGSQQAINAAKNVAGLRDSIGDAKALMDAFNPDRKFQAFSTAIRGAASGFTALQGAMGLFGGESEEVQKTLLKVQSALAFSEGLNSLTSLGDGFKVLKSVAVNAFQGIKGAIAATGIGLLVVAIGTIVAYWDDIKEAVWGTNSELERQNKLTQENLTAQEGKVKAIGDQENILRLQGKSEKEILGMKMKQTDEAIKFAEISLETSKQQKESQVAAANRNQSILKGILQFVTAPLQLLIDGVTKVANFFGADWDFNIADSVSSLVFDPEEVAKEGDEVIKEAEAKLTELKNQRAGFQLAVNEINKKAAADAQAKRDEETKALQEQIDAELELREGRHKREKEAMIREEKEKQDLRDELVKEMAEREKQREEAMKNANTSSGISGVLSPDQRKAREEALRGLLMSESQIKMEALDAEYAIVFEKIKGNEAAELALRQWYQLEKKKIDQAELESKLMVYDAIGGALGSLSGIFKKESAAAKVAALAEIAVGTGTGFIRALEIAQKSAKATGPAAAFAFPLFYASQIAAVLGAAGRAKAILSSGSGSGGGGGTPSAPVIPQAPLQPQLQTTTLNQNQVNQIGNAAAGGVGRSYVLNGDIQNAAQRDNAIERAATIG